MSAFALATAPKIDGMVAGDRGWEGVVSASGFRQVRPDEGLPATQKTEVFIGYLDESLYIGVIAYDDTPAGIIVTDSRRDSSLDDTDSFRVLIDGLLDRQNGFVFGTNPAGVEFDAQVVREGAGGAFGGGGFNLNWDASWSVSATVSAIGWSAEMQIPFKSLRYGKGKEQVWGINFQRNIRRNNEVVYWAPLSRQHNLNRISEAGTVTGVMPPAQTNLLFTPYVLAMAKRGGDLVETDTEQELGFDVKYSLTPSLTLDATYNTDFAQVEADEQQLNLDRFDLFLPEKRTFFLENSGQFDVGNGEEAELFFSRRIGIGEAGQQIPIDGGLRLSGKVGSSTNVGFLYMQSEAVADVAPGNRFIVARVNQELPNRSSIGAIFVDRNGDGSHLAAESDDSNRTYGIDGRLGIGENTIVSAWAAKTETPGLDGKDHAFSLKADFDSTRWFNSFQYAEVGDDFNPEVGFLTRKDYRKVTGLLLRRIRPDDFMGLLEMRPHVSYTGFWDFSGFQQTGFLHMDSHFEWRSGLEIHTGYNVRLDGIKEPFDIVKGVTVPADTYQHSEGQLVLITNQSAPLSLNLRTVIGGRFGGHRINIEPTINYRIGEKFRSSLSASYNDFDLPVPGGDFSVMLARFRLAYSFTPKILLQALFQYNDNDDVFGTNLRFSWLRSANTGLFVVYNEFDERGIGARPKGRELIIKYSYIFDVFQ